MVEFDPWKKNSLTNEFLSYFSYAAQAGNVVIIVKIEVFDWRISVIL